MSAPVAGGLDSNLAAPRLDHLTVALATLQAQVEGMQEEIKALKLQLGARQNFTALQFAFQMDYFPQSCSDLPDYLNFKLPRGYYKLMRNGNPPTPYYELCYF